MKTSMKKTVGKILIWLIAEIWLNYLGLDNLADYSEFIFQTKIAQFNTINQSIQI